MDALNISKALGAAGTETAGIGSAMIRDHIVAGITEYFEKRTPLYNQFRKEKTTSTTIAFKDQLDLPVASFGAELGAMPAPQHATYGERAVMLKSLYSRGEVSGQLVAASEAYIPALEREIRNHTRAMINAVENTLVVGDSSARPNEFDGLVKWITNTVDASNGGTAAPLRLSDLEVMRDSTTTGEYDLYIANAEVRRRLMSVILPQVRFQGETKVIDGGFEVFAYQGVPFVEVKPHTPQAAAAMENIILGVNRDMVWIPVLQDLTYEELAHVRDSTDFIIKMYLGLVVEGGANYHAKLTGFTTNVE